MHENRNDNNNSDFENPLTFRQLTEVKKDKDLDVRKEGTLGE